MGIFVGLRTALQRVWRESSLQGTTKTRPVGQAESWCGSTWVERLWCCGSAVRRVRPYGEKTAVHPLLRAGG